MTASLKVVALAATFAATSVACSASTDESGPTDGGLVAFDSSLPPDSDASGPRIDDANVAVDVVESSICDGSETLRLFYVSFGYRSSVYGAEVMEGAGVPFMLLDGHCKAYIRVDAWSPVGTKTMTPEDLNALAARWRVETWKVKPPRYCMPLDDGQVAQFGAPGSFWEIVPDAIGGCPEPPLSYLNDVQAYVTDLYAQATPMESKVAFSLVPFSSGLFEDSFKGARPWPLGPVETFVTDEQTPFRVAQGEQAGALRALRDAFLRGDLGRRSAQYIPIVQDNGAQFELRLRDVLPFERADGKITLR